MAYDVTGTAEATERGAGRADIYIYIHTRARIHTSVKEPLGGWVGHW